MDMVLLVDSSFRESSLCETVSTLSHKANINGIDEIFVVQVNDTSDVALAVDIAVHSVAISDPFIVSTCTTFLTKPFDLNAVYCREKFAVRKGVATDRMVNTMNHLLKHGCSTYDFELNVPIVVYKELASMVLSFGGNKHFRTMYGNLAHNKAQRIPDPHIDIWIHSMDPQGAVVSLGRTALKHAKCVKWLNKLREQCESGNPMVPAQ